MKYKFILFPASYLKTQIKPYLNPEEPTFLRSYIRKSYSGTLKRKVLQGPGKPCKP